MIFSMTFVISMFINYFEENNISIIYLFKFASAKIFEIYNRPNI